MSRSRPAVREPSGLRRSSRLGAVIAAALITAGITFAPPAGAAATSADAPSAPDAALGATVPAAPTDATASVGDGTLYVSWHPPAADGGAAVDSYTATARSSGGTIGGTCTVAALECAFYGLDDGLWTADVVATNAVGSSPAASTNQVRVDTTPPTVAWSAEPPWAHVLSDHATFTWAATDASGIDFYQVLQRRRVGSWTRSRLATAGTTVAMTAGRTVCLRVAAVDSVGNASGYSSRVCRTAPVDDRSGTAIGDVRRVRGGGFYAGTASQLRAQGAELEFTGVHASTAQLVVTTCSTCGRVQVRYDNRVVRTLSLRSATRVSRKVIPLPTAGGTPSIVLRSSGGRKVLIDGLVLRARA